MAKAERIRLIKEIEQIRESRVVTYVLGDRRGLNTSINEDVVRPMYDHVREFGHVPKLDLFLYSTGGVSGGAVENHMHAARILRRAGPFGSV